MAGPGGGPPRRSHTKSRKGCETCKRRHIRCDENFPQCRNCTKHNVRCPYMDMPPQDDSAPTPEKPDLMWTPEVVADIEMWQQTGVFPFPELNIVPAPNPQYHSTEELRLIHHVASISRELSMQDAGSFTIWTTQIPLFLRIGASSGYVMHALLAFSATHIAWLTDDALVNQMAFEHRGEAIKGLQEAIGSFSRETSDAVLAASLLLSWQANEWRGWTQLMHGTSSVIDAMQPWKNESQFGEFIAEQSTFPTAPPSPIPNEKLSQPRKQDIAALQRAYAQIQEVEAVLQSQGEDTTAVVQLLKFVRAIRKVTPAHNAAQRFEMLNPLRTWLFWLPIMYLQQTQGSANALVILAYYYTVALVVEPIFPEVGAAYFGSLSLGPIEEIARRMFSINIAQGSRDDLQTPLALMEYPIDMVSKFRARMGWKQPERTASFPTFEHSGYQQTGMYDLPSSFESGVYGNNPAFTYSQEHLTQFSAAEPSSAISPLTLDPFIGSSSNFLGIPSPSAFGGYHSPSGSSTFGDIAYSDFGGDEYLYEPQSSMSTFGGTSSRTVKSDLATASHPSSRSQTPIVPSSPHEYPRFHQFPSLSSPRPPYSQTYVSHVPFQPEDTEESSPKGKGRAKSQ